MSFPASQSEPIKTDATVSDSSMENAAPNTEQHHHGIPATGPDGNFSQELSRGVPLGGGFGGLRMPQSALLNPGPLNPAPIAHANNPLAAQASANTIPQQTRQAAPTQEFYPPTTVPADFIQQYSAPQPMATAPVQATYPATTAPEGFTQQYSAPQPMATAAVQAAYPSTSAPEGFTQQYSVPQPMPTASQTDATDGWNQPQTTPQPMPAAPVQADATDGWNQPQANPQPMPTATAQADATDGWNQPQANPQPMPTAPVQADAPDGWNQPQAAPQPMPTATAQADAPDGWNQPQAAPQPMPTATAQAENTTEASPEESHHQAGAQQTAATQTTILAENKASQPVSAPSSEVASTPQNTAPEKSAEAAKSAFETKVPYTKTAIPKPQPKRIGDILIDEGYITSQQLAQALQEGKATNSPLGAVLIRMGYIDEVHLGKALAKLHGLQYIDTSNLEIDPEVMKLVPSDFIRRHMVVPYRMDHAHKRIEVIMARPDNLHILDEVALLTGYRPIPRVSTHKELVSLLDKYYRSRSSADDAMARIEEDFSKQNNQYDQGGITKELEAEMDADDAPVVQLVNSILIEALDSNASDIHIEPQKERLLIRFRIDGILREMHSIPKKMGAAFISRVKVASGMDIAERRRPQDGRMRLKEGSQEVDMRVNTLATQFGEKIVIRLLRPNATTGGIEKLGLRSDEGKRIAKMVHAPHGIILVTGPTGSGKTTTLYSCLREINSPERNITTIEDPVEYPLSGVNQTQVSHKAGLTFSLCLRAILRQDPDVVMVGEIRDHETLEAAIHASLTGHLVFSTLHTNSASKTITRLLEMGAPNYLVSTAVIGILAQRLVRKVCNGCRVSYTSTEEEMSILNITEPVTLQKGEGCDKCGKSGYSGRVGLYEIMTMNREVQELVATGASTFQIQDAAVRNGMLTLGMDGKRKIYEGLTTVAEVTRVLGLDLDES